MVEWAVLLKNQHGKEAFSRIEQIETNRAKQINQIEEIQEQLRSLRCIVERSNSFSYGVARRQGAYRLPKEFRGLKGLLSYLKKSKRRALHRLRKEYRLVAGSVLFDAGWYRETYPDVGASRSDPVVHYLRFGASEGRNPSQYFDTRRYLTLYPDVAASGENPLVHFLRNGVYELRSPAAEEIIGARPEKTHVFGASERKPIAVLKSRRRSAELGAGPRLWFFVGDSLDWLAVHEQLTGVGRVSTELFFEAVGRAGAGRISPCVFDSDGRTLTAADTDEVMERLKDREGGTAASRSMRSKSRKNTASGPRPGDHVFFTGLVWTPNFTKLFTRLAREGIGFSVLLHDIIPLETAETACEEQTLSFAEWLTCILQYGDVIYVSTATVEDQVRRWALLTGIEIGAELSKISLGLREAPSSDCDLLTKASPKFAALRRESFVLSVGTIDKRKNQVYLCRTWQRLAKSSIGASLPQLVLAGRDDLGLLDQRSVFADLEVDGRLVVLEDLSDREIAALHDACLFTAFSPTREGYGLPVAESLRHGKLCLASSLPVIREHAGELIWYFDLDDETGSDALFIRAIADVDARRAAEQAIAAGFRLPDWLSTFNQMVEVALRVASEPLTAIDFSVHRAELPGAHDYVPAEVLELAARWCVDRNPEVSILVVNCNGAALTLECIRQIWAQTEGHAYEIVIVDNGSEVRDQHRLRNLGRGVRFLPLGCNRFFGEANNIAAEGASGEYVCLLNNTAFVQKGWLVRMIGALRRHPEVGAVGPMFLYPNGLVREAGAAVDAGGYRIRFGCGGGPSEASIQTEKYSDYVSAATLLLKRKLFMEVGGFDLAYEPNDYEDIDLCFKIIASGKKTLYCPEARVIHIESFSANGDVAAEERRMALCDLNRDKFVARWGRYLRDRDEAALAAARTTFVPSLWGTLVATSAQTKVAAVYTPYPLTPGGGERYLLTWAQALARDHRVLLVTPHPYSDLRLRSLAAEFQLDLAGLHIVSEAEFRSMSEPDVMVVMANEALPPIAPTGRINFYHCQFPFSLGLNPTGATDLQDYRAVVVNSQYTRDHYLKTLKESELSIADVRIIHPPVPQIDRHDTVKSPIILSVGRFFVGAHSKRQDLLIEAFKMLLNRSEQPLELHLAGSSTPQLEHMDYLLHLRTKAEALPIKFHVNIDHETLNDLYRRAAVYWHGTGLGQDLSPTPGLAEHFGISLVEAMSAGAVPFAFDAGGPREIIRPGEDGFLYGSLEQLVEETHRLLTSTSSEKREQLSAAARRRASDFSIKTFLDATQALLEEFSPTPADVGRGTVRT
jgi:glycosyltransferase involved in cell wall biosynthesis/GT2 family glycosyltransferase